MLVIETNLIPANQDFYAQNLSVKDGKDISDLAGVSFPSSSRALLAGSSFPFPSNACHDSQVELLSNIYQLHQVVNNIYLSVGSVFLVLSGKYFK